MLGTGRECTNLQLTRVCFFHDASDRWYRNADTAVNQQDLIDERFSPLTGVLLWPHRTLWCFLQLRHWCGWIYFQKRITCGICFCCDIARNKCANYTLINPLYFFSCENVFAWEYAAVFSVIIYVARHAAYVIAAYPPCTTPVHVAHNVTTFHVTKRFVFPCFVIQYMSGVEKETEKRRRCICRTLHLLITRNVKGAMLLRETAFLRQGGQCHGEDVPQHHRNCSTFSGSNLVRSTLSVTGSKKSVLVK